MLVRLYHEGELTVGQQVELSAANSHHLARVLRASTGLEIQLFNGDGCQYPARLVTVSNKHCSAEVLQCTDCNTESPLHITLLQGLSRNDRMDTCLQKATELGVNNIIPVICSRSKYRLDTARVQKKMRHWHQVIISACEQSGRCTVPQLQTPVALEQVLPSLQLDAGFVLVPQATNSLCDISMPGKHIAILIGPESGLDHQETEFAIDNGFTALRFGPRILRTETAGPAVIAAMQTLWGDTGKAG